jgi:hypothetical protein
MMVRGKKMTQSGNVLVTLSGFGHPSCHGYNTGGSATDSGFAAGLPSNR